MTSNDAPFVVAALYKFVRIADCAATRAALAAACDAAGIKGTLLIAPEGINGTIAGSRAGIDTALATLRALPGCADLEVKESQAADMPFYRMKVRIKKEIVTMGVPDVDPVGQVGTYVTPGDWNALISDPDVVLIDTRNDYEVGIGTFAGAINPKTDSFREFPEWFRDFSRQLADQGRAPKVAMFCTGGIRCEKATAFARGEGVDEVFHLQGGILKYLETVPENQSLWNGECFVFDQRVAVSHGLAEGSHSLCFACRMPLNAEDRAHPHHQDGIACVHCHEARDDDDRRRYAERHRQVARGMKLGGSGDGN